MVWTLIGKVGPYDTKAETDAKILVETNRAKGAEEAIQNDLTAETARATNAESELSGRITTNADAITQLESEIETKASATEVNTIKTDLGDLGDQVHGIEEKIPGKASATNQLATMDDIQQAGGLSEVLHDDTMTGNGTSVSPLSVKTDDFVKKSATEMQTISSPMTIKEEICLTDPEDNVAKHSLSIVAGVPTETATDMDIIGNRKYDTLPTTDDTTSYANLNPKSMITKGQVASAISTKADTTTVNSELATKATKSTDFMTALTSTNKGATKTEIDALDDKIDIAGTSGKIIGSYWFGKTKANTAVPAPTLIGQNYYDFTTGQVYKSTDGTTWTLDSTNTPPTDIDAQIIISSKFWDITEQDNQHGGKAWWSHTNSDWSYSPTIYEDKPAGGASLPLLTRLISDHQFNDESYLNANTFSWQAGSAYEAVYQHLIEDVASVANTTMYGYHSNAIEPNDIYSTISRSEEPYDIPLYQKLSDGVFVPISLSGTLVLEYFRESSLDTTGVIAETKDFAGINITYITAADGHRICLPDQESAISELYAKTGEANFYILDTGNAQFKLPRTQKRRLIRAVKNDDGSWYNLYSDGWVEQGGYVATELVTFPIVMRNTDYVPLVTPASNSSGNNPRFYIDRASMNVDGFSIGFGSYATSERTAYWEVSGYADSSVLENEPIEYEYYYVGNFTKEATENTAGLNAELFNNKVDLDLNNISAGGSNKIINTVFPDWDNAIEWNFTTNYHAPEDGWVFFKGNGISYDLYKEDETTVLILEFLYSSNFTTVMQPISKGQYLKYRNGSAEYSRMLFVPCKKA